MIRRWSADGFCGALFGRVCEKLKGETTQRHRLGMLCPRGDKRLLRQMVGRLLNCSRRSFYGGRPLLSLNVRRDVIKMTVFM